MRVESDQVYAPPFPREAEWINSDPLDLRELLERGPVLVEFWDFARVNSLRTLPYMEQWHERYVPRGASVIGVHTPGFSCSADAEAARAAVRRLEVKRPVVLDGEYALWHEYGNKGWPARYLWGPRGHIRYWHYGEGDYKACELALQDALREFEHGDDLPEPLAPLRPEDAPGAVMPPQTADIALPAEIERVDTTGDWNEGRDWLQAATAGAMLTASCEAGSAWGVLSGRGAEFPGCHELAIEDGAVTITASQPGLRVHALQFTPRRP
jgi:hypothetical protein